IDDALIDGADLRGARLDGVDLARAHPPPTISVPGDPDATRKLAALLAQHQEWISSSGRRGARADLVGAQLQGASLVGANLAGAGLAGADLTGAHLSQANLRLADMRGAVLLGASLDEACLDGANLSRADLTRVRARGVSIAPMERRDATGKPLGAT